MATQFSKYEIPNLPFAASYYGEDGWKTEDKTTPKMFTKAECTPAAQGGHPVSRDKMNKIGYLATIGGFLDRIGYPYGNEEIKSGTSNIEVGKDFGGYPKGAIVRILEDSLTSTGIVSREYISLVDNNTDPTPWTTRWSGNESDADTYHSLMSNQYWKPLFTISQYSYYPDYNKRTTLVDFSVSGATQTRTFTVPTSGWMYITRTLPNWDSIPDNVLFSKWANESSVRLFRESDFNDGHRTDEYTIEKIYPYEGKVATRLIPVGNLGFVIQIRNSINSNDFGPFNVKVELLGFEDED